MLQNQLTKLLKIEKPVIQGPMNWLTDANLVAAVSNNGGLGVLGSNAGQNEPADSVDSSVEGTRAEIRKTKQLTNKPFGLCIIPGYSTTDQYSLPTAKMAVEEHVPVVAYVGNVIREDEFKLLKENKITILFRPLSPDFKLMKKALDLDADALVVTSFDHGGDLPKKTISNFDLLPVVADEFDVPIIADGGVADHRQFNAALALGAQGVYAGTVFIASDECRAAQNVKDLIVKCTAEDLLLFQAAPAPFYRSLPTKVVNQIIEMSREGVSRKEVAKLMRGDCRNAMLNGDIDQGYVTLGNGISNIHHVRPVKAIIDELTQDFN